MMDRKLDLACDNALDGMSWSGGMTTLEALQCGLVPLTMSGLQMRTDTPMPLFMRLDFQS